MVIVLFVINPQCMLYGLRIMVVTVSVCISVCLSYQQQHVEFYAQSKVYTNDIDFSIYAFFLAS